VLVMNEHRVSERQACRLLEVDRATYRYEPRPERNGKLREAMREAAQHRPRFGYRRLWAVLTARQGWSASVGRVQRLCQQEKLTVPRLKRKRLKGTVPADPLVSRPNQEWALDIVSDALTSGRALRLWSDAGNRSHNAWTVISEIGVDMSPVPVNGNLASWCGLCPGNAASAGKRHSGRTTKGNRYIRRVLVQAAWGSGPDQPKRKLLHRLLLPDQQPGGDEESCRSGRSSPAHHHLLDDS
jgi:hypothetical protein